MHTVRGCNRLRRRAKVALCDAGWPQHDDLVTLVDKGARRRVDLAATAAGAVEALLIVWQARRMV